MGNNYEYKIPEEAKAFYADRRGTLTPLAYLNGAYVGTKKTADWLDELGVVPELATPGCHVCSVGFCEAEQAWYGWSHQAFYNFKIGSVSAPGELGYRPATPEGLLVARRSFLPNSRDTLTILPDRSGIQVSSPMTRLRDDVDPNKEDGFTQDDFEPAPPEVWEIKCGRGTWTAKTLADCREMAVDFAEAVN